MPENTIYVGRPGKFGNPFNWTTYNCHPADKKRVASECYELWLKGNYGDYMAVERRAILDSLVELRGKDLACWCNENEPCHADVLLKMAEER